MVKYLFSIMMLFFITNTYSMNNIDYSMNNIDTNKEEKQQNVFDLLNNNNTQEIENGHLKYKSLTNENTLPFELNQKKDIDFNNVPYNTLNTRNNNQIYQSTLSHDNFLGQDFSFNNSNIILKNNNELSNSNSSSFINIDEYLNTSFQFSEYKPKKRILELLNKLEISLIETSELLQKLNKASDNNNKLLNEIRTCLNENNYFANNINNDSQ